MPYLAPKKRLGQNFLIDKSIVDNIILSAGQLENKSIIEIGGGTGNLTKYLLETNPKKLVVIEIDQDYNHILTKVLKSSRVETMLINQDILSTDISNYFSEPPIIFGNLPYNISTKILSKLLIPVNEKRNWEKLFLMFQLEVAKRIVAPPNTKDYGRLSLFSQFYSHPTIEFQISKKSFFPQPKVESALVKFEYNDQYYKKFNNKLFSEIIKMSFQGRRKMLKNSLKNKYDDICSILETCGIAEDCRAETLSLDQFCTITDKLDEKLA